MNTNAGSHQIVIDQVLDISNDLTGLVSLLTECVEDGASIGFFPPLALEDAQSYWRDVAGNVSSGRTVLLVARLGQDVIASVQLALAGKANARHRAEIERLMVVPAARRRGIASTLLAALEEHAVLQGRRLLVLDTREGDVSEQVYLRCGFTRVGVIPEFAQSADGRLDGTVFYYKLLD